jgi:hypothetical protein
MIYIFQYILACISCMIIHILGHYLTAWCFGNKLKFYIYHINIFNKIKIPRLCWCMPNLSNGKKAIIAWSGFLSETLFAMSIMILFNSHLEYGIFVIIHLLLYKHYAGNISDFNYTK